MTATEQPPAPAAALTGGLRRRRSLAALAGIVAAALALGVGELVAALIGPASSPVVAVGGRVISLTPEPVKEFAIRAFGENDKRAAAGDSASERAVNVICLTCVGSPGFVPGEVSIRT